MISSPHVARERKLTAGLLLLVERRRTNQGLSWASHTSRRSPGPGGYWRCTRYRTSCWKGLEQEIQNTSKHSQAERGEKSIEIFHTWAGSHSPQFSKLMDIFAQKLSLSLVFNTSRGQRVENSRLFLTSALCVVVTWLTSVGGWLLCLLVRYWGCQVVFELNTCLSQRNWKLHFYI